MTMPDYGTGLMAFWSDIDDDYLMRYQQWHNCEHMPERVSTPGFRRGRRFRCVTGAPHFLMMYETQSPATLASDSYMAKLNKPTQWTNEALTHFRNPYRGIYSKADQVGEEGAFCATWITSLRFTLREQTGEETMRDWLSAIASQSDIGRVQLWRADVATSAINTSERKIYGGPAAGDHLLLLIESMQPQQGGKAVLIAGGAAAPPSVSRADEVLGQYWLELYHHSQDIYGDAA
ncbi:hypothetical protein DXT91_28790 [Agrobacterium tumefaciens]|uniref:DUF4286 family protein n=1 Tax=Agrobacterium tumefaciens TaxID=358 RepID=UPI0012BA27E8|nr:DUF4286 family protein [Agrobacterium tumefaciens]MQB08036.1 hypothetical protein [Agrobacterium tumefaciens]